MESISQRVPQGGGVPTGGGEGDRFMETAKLFAS